MLITLIAVLITATNGEAVGRQARQQVFNADDGRISRKHNFSALIWELFVSHGLPDFILH